jgi:hypothetical protein
MVNMDEMFYGTLPQDTQDFSQVLRGVGRSIGDIGRGVSYYPYDLLGAPVDIINMALQPVGLGSERPVLGSDYLRNIAQSLGYAQPSTGSGAETAGRLGAAFVNPAAGARAVGQAGNLVTRGANLSADKLVQMITGNPQATAPRVLEETSMPFMQAMAPKAPTSVPQSTNLQMAREAAESLGMSPDEQVRMLQMGFEPGWYHGTTGDIEKFRLDLLGEATGAQSAKKGFFFARDPINPPQEVLQKSNDPNAIELLKKAGKTDDEIAELNKGLQPGSGARTASGYSLIGGDREYREAMRKASLAEKRQDWDEYDKQMAIAEDFAIGRQQNSQALVAKYGDARDTMIDKVQNAFFNKELPQAEAEALDARFRELMPYGWYNQFEPEQFDMVKQAIKEIAPKKLAKEAEKAIDDFIKVKNERTLDEKTQSGSNVLPIALSYKNPLVYDFKGNAYREHKYADLLDEAKYNGNDAVIMLNTFDPGAGKAELVDVGVVFDPSQIRSKFAAFDPTRTKESDILAGSAGVGGAGLLGAGMMQDEEMF